MEEKPDYIDPPSTEKAVEASYGSSDYNPIKHEFRNPDLSQGLVQLMPTDWSKFRRMTLEEIITECDKDSKDWFPAVAGDLFYQVGCLAGEAGELVNEAKKVHRGTHTMEEKKAAIEEEAIDVLIYLACVFGILGTNVSEVYRVKRARNVERFGSASSDPAGE